MATIADVLEHLVAHAPGLYPEGRAEFLAAISRELRHIEPGPQEPGEPGEPGAGETQF